MIFEAVYTGVYLNRLSSTGENLSIRCNDSISRWTYLLTIPPQRTDGATVIARDYMVDRDYHVLRKDQGTRPFSFPPRIISHVRPTAIYTDG